MNGKPGEVWKRSPKPSDEKVANTASVFSSSVQLPECWLAKCHQKDWCARGPAEAQLEQDIGIAKRS